MENQIESIMRGQDCDKIDRTRIKEENFNNGIISAESQEHVMLQTEPCFEDGFVDTKIGIKQETCDPYVDTKPNIENPPILDSIPFEGMGLSEGAEEIDSKEGHLNKDELSTQSDTLHLLHNETHFIECDVGTKIATKQDTWNPNAESRDIKSDPEKLDSGIIITEEEIDIKEANWWHAGVSTDPHKDVMESNAQKNGASTELLSLESPRLPVEAIYPESNLVSTLDKEKYDTSTKTICGMKASHSTSMRQSNSTSDKESEQNKNEIFPSTIPYKCEHCEKCFKQRSHLKRHTMLHLGIKPYKCDRCGKCFTENSDLKKHTLLHSGTKPYRCDICQKCFKQKTNLQSHALLHSGTKPYKCDICEKCFSRKSNLRSHNLLHSGILSYNCDMCEKCFTKKSNLIRHRLLHSGIKPCQCDTCGKCFALKSDLKRHELIHTGTKPHKCDICEKSFTQKSDLQTHSLLHSDIKSHKCEVCEKYFKRKSHLECHKLIHTGTKPYKCDICEKCFTWKSELQTHTLLHSGIKPHQCDTCGKCFTWKSSLLRHALKH